MRALIILVLLLCSGCSQNSLLSKRDYSKSQHAFISDDNKQALLDFPRGREDGDFITTMEKSYLFLLQGNPQLAGLQKQAALQENQVRYHVSREARTFFYVRTPEDYYPGEHEVIWLHFMLGWGHALKGKYSDACVEARIADSLLSLPWSPNGHFDDPALRLFAAGLWTMCGNWREAQVDLRAAQFLDSNLTWTTGLTERDSAPRHLFIVLGGPGPDVLWDPEFKLNPLRSGRRVAFKLRGRKSMLSIRDQTGRAITPYLSPDAGKWYERDLARESELDEIIQDSAYGGKAAASSAKATAIFAGNTGEGILTGIATGALIGAGMLAYGDTRNGNTPGSGTGFSASNYKTAAALGGVLGGIIGGIVGAAEGYEQGAAEIKEDLDPSPYYRYVRYLPEYLWIGWSDQPITYPVTLTTPSQTLEIPQPSVINGTAVTIAHLPDSRQTECVYRDGQTSNTLITAPDAAGNCPPEPDY